MTCSSRQYLLQHPAELRTWVRLPGQETVVVRLLQRDDAPILGRYFLSLSAATRRVYAPHAFDLATAVQLCAQLDPSQTMRFVALSSVETDANAGASAGPGRGPSCEDDAETDASVIAYIIVRLTPGAGEVQRYASAGICLDPQTTFYLAPSVADRYQSRGVGSALMQPILSWLRHLGCRRLVLSGGVRAENARAKRFYAKLGFRHVGDFRTQGEVDNHDMVLDLD
jgi:diamine N-acetyltransferase